MRYGSSALQCILASARDRGDHAAVARLEKSLAKAEKRDCERARELGQIARAQAAFDKRFLQR